MNNIKSKSEVQPHNNSMNASSLERKIDEGVVTEPPKIARNISSIFSTKRQEIMIGDKKMTQKDLAQRVNLPVADITSMENGSMIMNHDNKIKVRKVQRVLNIPHLDL
jgi:ribosome-binding protein aMBF1 (putative translation factor)